MLTASVMSSSTMKYEHCLLILYRQIRNQRGEKKGFIRANYNRSAFANLNHSFIKIYKTTQGPYDQFIQVLNVLPSQLLWNSEWTERKRLVE